MKLTHYFAAAFAAFALISHATANIYEGSMICTVTTSNDPLMAVGTVFENNIVYFTDSMDGTFFSTVIPGVHDDPELIGRILTPTGEFPAVYDYRSIRQGNFGATFANQITITDGVVTNFIWGLESGGENTGYSLQNFSFQSAEQSNNAPPSIVHGTVVFSAITERIPESGSTIVYLIAAALFAAAFGRAPRQRSRNRRTLNSNVPC